MAVEADRISKRYPNGTLALEDVSLRVDFGEVVACLGRNGAGKTTLVGVLATLLRPSSGRARVCGFDTVTHRRQARAALGASLQRTALDDLLTPREHLMLAGRLAGLRGAALGQRIDELVTLLGFGEVADRLVATLSGGTQRRVDLAVALVRKPLVLFLDEPTTGLDPQSRRALWDWIRGYVGDGGAVLLTTQYLEEADELAHRVAILDHGRNLIVDTPWGLKGTIGGKVLRWRPSGRGEQSAAARVLQRSVDSMTIQAEADGRIRVDLHSDEGLPSILSGLQSAGVSLARLTITEPTLEDVFVRLTGRHVAGEVAEPVNAAVAAAGRSLATRRGDR